MKYVFHPEALAEYSDAVQYGILYTIEQDYILILAVMHCSREVGYWKNRK